MSTADISAIELAETFAESLRRERIKAGMTQSALAKLCKMPQPAIARFESASRGSVPTLETVELLAKHLSCSPSRLVGWK